MTKRRVPSPGPRPYPDELSDCFFGRGTDIAMIMDRVYGQRLSVLMAESASGKTSLLQAGVIPALRKNRLVELAATSRSAPQFPLLLNQWLGRVTGNVDFVRLVTCEADRYLGSCVAWYQRTASSADAAAVQKELASIAAARGAVRDMAAQLGLAMVDPSTDQLVATPGVYEDDDTMLGDLLDVLAALSGAFGTVLLILDQFEEVLGDPVLGRQAMLAVEAIFDNCRQEVRQFLSLRNDSIHLLEPLERKSILEGKRRVSIKKLEAPAVNTIVGELSDYAGLKWVNPADRERLVGTFTSPRLPRDVNLLGLQVVLAELFGRLIERDATTIDLDALASYCKGLGMDGDLSSWLDVHPDENNPSEVRSGKLAEVAPREWIDRCLDKRHPDEPADVVEGYIKPMVMHMADWLVTPAGFKRPMTLGELEKIAFRSDLSKNRRTAGIAKEWSRERLEAALEHTCEAALARLVEGHVLKARGGASDKTYELVHDQFGRPLRQWAETFGQSPAADLASPFEIADRPFEWSGHLRQALPEGLLQDVAWVGCTIRGVDFSDLTLLNCDLQRTLFQKCTFNVATRFEDCDLHGAIFEDCAVTGSVFASCNLDSLLVSKSTRLDGVRITGGSMRAALLTGSRLRDCGFVGTSRQSLIPMKNTEISNCELEGTITFDRCSLDGATIGDETAVGQAGEITFIDCDLRGAELRNLRFEQGKFEVRGGSARGAVFERITVSKRAGCSFDSVTLTGAVFLGCEVRGAVFRGDAAITDARRRTAASTLVFRHWGSDEDPILTVLDGVTFQDLDLENFSFLNCRIEGGIEFRRCGLSGGTIRGAHSDGSSRVHGGIAFLDGCDLAALELNTLDFTGHVLQVSDCNAPGVYFEDVTLAPSAGSERSARFERTDMPGALFFGCRLHSVLFEGPAWKRASLETLVVRGTDALSASIADCRFEHVNLENFTFEDCVVAGPLTFTDCLLSGGTFGKREETAPMPIMGMLAFTAGCDLSAIEVVNVRFGDEARLIAASSDCRGALFRAVTFAATKEPGLLMEDVSLSGTIFTGCTIGRASFVGGGNSHLQQAWGLVFRDNRVEDVLFRDYDCDGASFENIDIGKSLVFDGCSLLRSKFVGIRTNAPGAALDLRDSDVLYAEIEQNLLEQVLPVSAGTPAAGSLAILPGQLEASRSSAAGRKHLRLTERKR